MMRFHSVRRWLLPLLLCVAGPLAAQEHVHTPGMTHPAAPTVVPTQGGHAAFAAIAEIVALLEADPATDWSKVNVERLRRHLIDMDLVTLHSRVTSTPVSGGVQLLIRGRGEAIGAIQRMTAAHVGMVAAGGGPRIVRSPLADGVKLLVTAREPGDVAAMARIRALGFIGLMAQGDHHAAHHLALARGDAMADHGH
jgi:hypothetical protein